LTNKFFDNLQKQVYNPQVKLSWQLKKERGTVVHLKKWQKMGESWPHINRQEKLSLPLFYLLMHIYL